MPYKMIVLLPLTQENTYMKFSSLPKVKPRCPQSSFPVFMKDHMGGPNVSGSNLKSCYPLQVNDDGSS